MADGSGTHPPTSNGFAQYPAVWFSPLLDSTDRNVLLALLSFSQRGRCWPSRPALAERCGGLDERTVGRHCDRLRGMGLIEWERGGFGRSNVYTLHTDRAPVPLLDQSGHPRPVSQGTRALTIRAPMPNELDKENQTMEPDKAVVAAGADGFDAWWSLYPRKVGKKAARTAWERATKTVDPAVVMAGLRAQVGSLRAREITYCPHPTTWLNQGRWEDDVAAMRNGHESGTALLMRIAMSGQPGEGGAPDPPPRGALP